MENINFMHIVYATDENYLNPTLVAVASALAWANDRRKLNIHILDVGFGDELWARFVSKIRHRFGSEFGLVRHRIDVGIFKNFKSWHGSLGTYARLCIPELLNDVDWCVYADGDTLFVQDPLILESIFDPQKAIQGHEDWLPSENFAQRKLWYESNGLDWDYGQYFCAGFVLMNLNWFRAKDAMRSCIKFLESHLDVICPDQDALAVTCCGNVGRLPEQWGMFSGRVFDKGQPLPACIHYAAELPWKFEFKRYLGYSDVKRVWLRYAERLLRLKPKDFGGPCSLGMALLLFGSDVLKWFMKAVGVIPLVRRRYSWVYVRYATRDVVKALVSLEELG